MYCRHELLFYPRYHLDDSSLLCRKPLLTKPIVMDVYQDYILVTYHPFDVHIFHAEIHGELTPTSNPTLQVEVPSNQGFVLIHISFFLTKLLLK